MFSATKSVRRAPIVNPPNSAQQEGTYTIPPKLHPGPCGSMGKRRGTERQTDTQTAVANTHFASGVPHAKYHNVADLVNVNMWL